MSDKINLFDFDNTQDNTSETKEELENKADAAVDQDDYSLENGFSIYNEEDYVCEENEEYEYEMKQRNQKNIIKTIIWICVIVLVSLSVAYGIIVLGADYLGIGSGRGHNVEITIPTGSTTADIAEILEEKGVINSKLFFRVYSRIKHYDGKYQSGTRVIDSSSGYGGVAEALTKKGVVRKSVKVTIIEGWSVDEIAAELEKKGVCSADDFKYQVRQGEFDFDFVKEIPVEKVYYRLEGYLYPDTYDFLCHEDDGFSSSECAFYAIDKMLQNLDKMVDKDLKKKIDKSDYTFHEIMTLSSIIEQEAGLAKYEDRQKVARLFYNRLEGVNWSGPRLLQSDPSTFYPYGNGKYNTYQTPGLPVGPMSSPSITSIKAAINPQDNFKATYFVTDSEGKFYFNETLAAHNKTIADLKRAGKWIYTTLGE